MEVCHPPTIGFARGFGVFCGHYAVNLVAAWADA